MIKYYKYKNNYFHRQGLHLAYELVPKNEATWRNIQGLFWVWGHGRAGSTQWLVWEKKPTTLKKVEQYGNK